MDQSGLTENELAYREACQLALILKRKHYPENPEFYLLPDIRGVISQIDNMTTGLTRIKNGNR